jgi:hypothetical protein
MELTQKDVGKLKLVLGMIENGTATTYDKKICIESLNSIIEPKCAVCRSIIKEDQVIVNDRKMHQKCRPKYKM